MLAQSDYAEERDSITVIRFFDIGGDKEPFATLEDAGAIPIPSEGDSLILTDSQAVEVPGDPDLMVHEGEWDFDATIPPLRVAFVRYEYELAKFPDDVGNDVEQLITYVEIHFQREEDI